MRPLTRRTLPALILVPLALGAWHLSTPPEAAYSEGEEESVLSGYMEQMGSNFKKLKAQVGEPSQTESSLELILEMQGLIVSAKREVPGRIVEVPEPEQEAWLVDYRKKLNGLLGELCALEIALLENRHAEAEAHLLRMFEMMKAAHKIFRPAD